MKRLDLVKPDPESEVWQYLEQIEIDATCISCGRMSFAVLKKQELCPICFAQNGRTVDC